MTNNRSDECIFCKIAKGEIKADMIKKNKEFIAFGDKNPVVEGHTLIVSKNHYVNLMDMPNKLGGEMIKFSKEVAKEMMDKKLGDGFNIVMNNFPSAGQVVMHAHLHVIPRKGDDGIKFIVK